MPTPLATTADLAARGIVNDFAQVDVFLDVASSVVRQAAGSHISQITVTVPVAGTSGQWLRLPGAPVSDVASVEVDDVPVGDFKLSEGRLWRRHGWQSRHNEPSIVKVTYTFGLPTVPEHIIDLVCSMVAAAKSALDADADGLGLASDNGRVQSVSIDGFSESYATSADAVAAVTEMSLPRETRVWLASQFGGGLSMLRSE